MHELVAWTIVYGLMQRVLKAIRHWCNKFVLSQRAGFLFKMPLACDVALDANRRGGLWLLDIG